MENKEFYEKLLAYEQEGKILYAVKRVNMPDRFFRIKIGNKRYFCLHTSIVDFASIIEQKAASGDFLSQSMIEERLHCSGTKIADLVNKGKYVIIVRGNKFYIKKDW